MPELDSELQKYLDAMDADGFQQVFRALETSACHTGLVQGFLQHPAYGLIVVNNPDCQRFVSHVARPWLLQVES